MSCIEMTWIPNKKVFKGSLKTNINSIVMVELLLLISQWLIFIINCPWVQTFELLLYAYIASTKISILNHDFISLVVIECKT